MGRPVVSAESLSPYRLYDILRQHGISQSDVARNVLFEGGRRAGQALATSTISFLILRRVWPRTVSVDAIKSQVATYLASRGVPADEIAQAWIAPDGAIDVPPVHQTLIGHGAPKAPTPPKQPIDDFKLPEATMLSQQAREQFNLVRHPFIDDVQEPGDVYLSKDQIYVREAMYYAAKHSGLIAVIGESGSGKSTLRRDLVDRIRRDSSPIAVVMPKCIDKEVLTAAHVCDAIVADMSQEAPKLSLEAKARQIERIFIASARNRTSHVIIIEEAHDLSIPMLKYLKRFWELEDGFRKLVGVVLIGQPELGEKLDERKHPELRELIKRIEVARVKPLNGNLESYLTLKFKRIGIALDDVFERGAFDAIRARLTRRKPNTNSVESHLYPLNVNNVICAAMNTAAELGLPKVSADLIGRV